MQQFRDTGTNVVARHECLDSRKIYLQNLAEIHEYLYKSSYLINVLSSRLQHESCVYIVNLCREIVAN